jgi:hypothetical protein
VRRLLSETYEWSVWSLPLEERFERRGAYFIPNGTVDWSDPELGARYVPDHATAADANAWVPGDELFVPCRHSDGHLLGIVSVGEPVSGLRPSDDQLDLLVAMVSLTARALQGAQEAVEAAPPHRAQAAAAGRRSPSEPLDATVLRRSATASPALDSEGDDRARRPRPDC